MKDLTSKQRQALENIRDGKPAGTRLKNSLRKLGLIDDSGITLKGKALVPDLPASLPSVHPGTPPAPLPNRKFVRASSFHRETRWTMPRGHRMKIRDLGRNTWGIYKEEHCLHTVPGLDSLRLSKIWAQKYCLERGVFLSFP